MGFKRTNRVSYCLSSVVVIADVGRKTPRLKWVWVGRVSRIQSDKWANVHACHECQPDEGRDENLEGTPLRKDGRRT